MTAFAPIRHLAPMTALPPMTAPADIVLSSPTTALSSTMACRDKPVSAGLSG
jgi:hypothetical protein